MTKKRKPFTGSLEKNDLSSEMIVVGSLGQVFLIRVYVHLLC